MSDRMSRDRQSRFAQSSAALRAFMQKEVRHLLRDKQTLSILLLLPLAQLLLFGFAVRTDVNNIRVAVVAPSLDIATAALQTQLAHSGRFTVLPAVRTVSEVEALFRRERVDVGIILEGGIADALAAGEPVRIEIVADASDPNNGTTMQNYTLAALREWQQRLGASTPGVRIETRVRMRFNQTLESVNLFVPGLIALILTLVAALMTAISLSKEKERGTYEILLVSPLHPWQIIIGKVMPYLVLSMANLVTVLVAARLVFGVPFVGSVPLLVATAALFALVSLSLGVLIAAITNSQLAAMLAALGGTMLPSTMLSGMIFPIASLPLPMQVISNIIPARWFIQISRGIMLKGAGIAELWQPILVLCVMLVVLLTLAIRRTSVRLA
jgi:ABC-2 type transport system permease protein